MLEEESIYQLRMNKNFCKLAEEFYSSSTCKQKWKDIILSHVRLCSAIIDRDYDAFIAEVPENHYLLFTSPEFLDESSEVEGEDVPVRGTLYISLDDSDYGKYSIFEISIYALLYRESVNIQVGDNDWIFFKSVSQYLKESLVPLFKNSFSNKEPLDNIQKSFLENDISDFKSFWQNYIHLLSGSKELLEREELRAYFEPEINTVLKKIMSPRNPNMGKNPVIDWGDLLFVKDPETFKMLLDELYNKNIDKIIAKNIGSISNQHFWRNLLVCLKNFPERNLDYLEISYWESIYYSLSGILDESFPSSAGWSNFLNRIKREDEPVSYLIFDELNIIFQKKYSLVHSKVIDSDLLYLMRFSVEVKKDKAIQSALLSVRRKRSPKYSLKEKTWKEDLSGFVLHLFRQYSDKTLNRDLNGLFEFMKFLEIPEIYYKIYVDKVILEKHLHDFTPCVDWDLDESNDFKI